MASLMVIFILLLLVFVNNQASVTTSVSKRLLEEMKHRFSSAGIPEGTVTLAPEDPSMLVVALPPELTFDRNKATLRPEGKAFVEREIPKLMEVVCSEDFRKNVESVTVEGYSDKVSSLTPVSAGTERNLKLSQARAMAVARGSLAALGRNTAQQACLLEKLAVSGRTEQDFPAASDVNRRVALKVRVRSAASIRAT